MIDFLKAIIRPTYWITHQHPVPQVWQIGLTVFFGTLIGLGVIAFILRFIRKFPKPFRRVFSRVAAWGITMGFIGYALLFFSVQQVAFVSARMFYLFWLATALIWLYFIIRYLMKDVPRLVSERQAYLDSQKYLPKRKK